MGKEIKYRAWIPKQKGENLDVLGMVYFDLFSEDNRWISDKKNYNIMQYTGLKDKNGKEIYEGDILRWQDWEQEGTEKADVYIVSYKAPSFIWDCYRENQKLETNGEVLRDTKEFEIIGNIFENPELLVG